MGYTHYFAHGKTSKAKWAKILTDCNTLRDHLSEEIKIAGWDGNGKPIFNDTEIRFNGVESHETFSIAQRGAERRPWHEPNELPSAFCKTARKPYDLLVCACLLVYKHHSPDTMELGSDGDSEDWKDAENFVKETLGYDDTFLNHNKYGEDK